MSTVNLYDVLNLSNDCSTKEIKESYRLLAKEFHPDKITGDEEMFELVTHAYNILINSTSRKEYDELYSISKQCETDHFDLKNQSSNFLKALETDVTKKVKSKKEKETDFKKAFEDFDRIRGVSREKEDLEKLLEKDTSRRVNDYKLARDQDDIENIQEKLFDKFVPEIFNQAFDDMYKNQTELTKHTGNPDAWNSVSGFDATFSTVDNYENLFADEDNFGTSAYCPVNIDNNKKKKLTREDVDKISSTEYTKGHNIKDKDYKKLLEERMRERELESTKYNKRDLVDFDTDPTCGGYSIFNNIGIKNQNTISWENDKDIKTKYKKLLELRKSELDK